jgi:hypothetical protein
MIFLRRLRYSFAIFAFLCSAPLSSIANNDVERPTLRVQGEEYENACGDDERKKMREMLVIHGAQDASQISDALEAIMCAPEDAASRAYVKKLIPVTIKKTVESTGDVMEQRTVKVSEDLIGEVMARGNAWNTDIEVKPRKVILQYFSNAACIKSAKMNYIKSKWILYEFGEACD